MELFLLSCGVQCMLLCVHKLWWAALSLLVFSLSIIIPKTGHLMNHPRHYQHLLAGKKRTTPIAGLTTAVAEIAKECAKAQQESSQQCGSIVSAAVPSSCTSTSTSSSSNVSPARMVDL